MPKAVVAYVKAIESVMLRIGKGLSIGGILTLVFILLFEAISRYAFNKPLEWSIELATFVMGTYFFIGGGYVLLTEGHVRMDALYSRWSPRKRAIADVATFFPVGVWLIVFLLGGIRNVEFSLSLGQHSQTPWAPPLAPIKIIMVVGVVLILLQAIACFFRDLAIIRKKPIQ